MFGAVPKVILAGNRIAAGLRVSRKLEDISPATCHGVPRIFYIQPDQKIDARERIVDLWLLLPPRTLVLSVFHGVRFR